LGPPIDWYGDVAPELKSKIRLGYTSDESTSAIAMIACAGGTELEGKGLGPRGVNAMPRGRPGRTAELSGSTFPVASAANSIKSAFCVLKL
jgi:hypothetical protein